MAKTCDGCGSDVLPGQRFCRVCGRPTGNLGTEDSPTQVMPPGASMGGYGGGPTPPSGAATGPAQRPQTNPVYPPAQYYGAQYPAQAPAVAYQPARSGSRWGWIVALVAIGVFGTIMLGILMAARRIGRNFRGGMSPHSYSEASTQPMPGESLLSEGGDVSYSGGEVTITRSFPFRAGESLSIANVSGDLQVEGWDGPTAEVKVIKTGGSDGERGRVRVFFVSDSNRLAMRTDTAHNRNVSVRYEVRVPRGVGRVDLKAISSDVALSNVSGGANIDLVSGSIDLNGVTGAIRTKTVSGGTNVVYDAPSNSDPLEFSSVSGTIELEFKQGLDADLKAATVSGNIDLDDNFGINVEKKIVGREASGTIGKGGRPLSVTTVSGGISITSK